MEGDFCSAARAGTASVRANTAAASTAIPPDACRYRTGYQERVAPGAGGCGGDRQEGELRPGPGAKTVPRVGRQQGTEHLRVFIRRRSQFERPEFVPEALHVTVLLQFHHVPSRTRTHTR